jgi:hypothetical protein
MKSSKGKTSRIKYFHLPALGNDHMHDPLKKNIRGNGLSLYFYIKIGIYCLHKQVYARII